MAAPAPSPASAGGAAALFLLGALAGCGRGGPVEADVLIHDVTLIDGSDAGARPGMSVAVRGDRIVAVGPAAEVTVADGVARIDGAGRFLIPGLWDMHVHVAGYRERSFPLFLANGVTSIREMGGDPGLTAWMRQESRYGRLLGPRMLIAGATLNGEIMARGLPPDHPLARGVMVVRDSAEAVRAVDSLARVGVDFIKVHAAVPRAAYVAAVAAAGRHGLAVVGHVPDALMPREAIEAGQRTIEHGSRQPFANSARGEELTAWMVAAMQAYLDEAGARARPDAIVRLRRMADDSAMNAFDLGTAQAFAAWAVAREVWFDPTLVVYRLVVRGNEPALRARPEQKYVPRAARELDELPPPDPRASPAAIEAGRRRWEQVRGSFAALVSAGARFLAGSDLPVGQLVPGFSLHEELVLLREIGLSPLQALQAATRNAAEASGLLDEAGTIETGKAADLVLLDADPLADIANTARVHAVVVRGRLLDRATLDRMLADAEVFARQ